jgi:hypothetical protein
MSTEVFTVECPRCQNRLNATLLAATLPDQVLFVETARRNGRRQTPHAGPGRPTLAQCAGCDVKMSASELREHRGDCVRHRLGDLMRQGLKVRLFPKEPDPYPDFRIESTEGNYVTFQKLSSQQRLEIDLAKIAEMAVDRLAQTLTLRLLGRVIWKEEAKNSEWRFIPSRIGRPKVRV